MMIMMMIRVTMTRMRFRSIFIVKFRANFSRLLVCEQIFAEIDFILVAAAFPKRRFDVRHFIAVDADDVVIFCRNTTKVLLQSLIFIFSEILKKLIYKLSDFGGSREVVVGGQGTLLLLQRLSSNTAEAYLCFL